MVDENEDNVYLFTNLDRDFQHLKNNKSIRINAKDYKPEANDLIILRGERAKLISRYEQLLEMI